MSLSIALQKGRKLPTAQRPSLFASLDRSLRTALDDRLDAPFWFDTTRYPGHVDIRVQVPEGVLRIIAPRDRAFATQGHIFILWMVVATLLLTAVAILFIRNQVRAIERLADAADAFGRGIDQAAFKPHGAREVRKAARAFLAMKARIQRHIEQRTALLASVSHDLRTPLTRLKLELALAEPSAQIDAMQRDLSEMEHMIDEYLSFARGEGGGRGIVLIGPHRPGHVAGQALGQPAGDGLPMGVEERPGDGDLHHRHRQDDDQQAASEQRGRQPAFDLAGDEDAGAHGLGPPPVGEAARRVGGGSFAMSGRA
jgi:signal transduction histidine kinase